MTRNKIGIGEVVDLSDAYEQMSRRRFMQVLGGLGAGTIGLSRLIESVEGAEPEGEPLVHTRGKNGEPERVRIVSGHRHSVITRYETMSMEQFDRQHPDVISVGLLQRSDDEDDLAYEFVYDAEEYSQEKAKEKAPSQFRGVPVEPAVEAVEVEHDHHLRGGDGVVVEDDDGDRWLGTATCVCYDGYGNEIVLTNKHVGDGGFWLYDGGSKIGYRYRTDGGTDTAAYRLFSTVDSWPRATKYPLNNLYSAWTFGGISDYLSYYGSMPVELHGATSEHITNEVRETRRNKWYNLTMTDYDIRMDDRNCQGGDSGGPWVHRDYGALVAQHVGGYSGWFVRDCDVGSAAWETLQAVDAHLWDPS